MMALTKALLLALFVTILSAGCVMVVPLPPLGPQRGAEEIESLRVGGSTREDVQQALGRPHLLVGDRYEIFELREEAFNLFGILGTSGGLMPMGVVRHRVLVEYDPGGVLESLQWEAHVEEAFGYRVLSSDSPPAVGHDGDTAASAESVQPVLTWERPESRSSSIAVAPTGRTLAMSYNVPDEVPGGARSLTQLRDRQTGALLQEISDGLVGCPQLVPPRGDGRQPTAFLSDGIHLASIARKGDVCLWDPTTQRVAVTLSQGTAPITQLASARTAPILASADTTGLIKLWDGTSGRELVSVDPCALEPGCFQGGLNALALSDDGRLLVTLQSARHVRLWDAAIGPELAKIALRRGFPGARLALSSSPKRLAIHVGDHLQIWRFGDAPPGEPSQEVSRRSGMTTELEHVLLLPYGCLSQQWSLGFSGDGTRLAAGKGSVVVWETATWRQVARAVPELCASDLRWERGFVLTPNGAAIVTDRGVWQLPQSSEIRYGFRADSSKEDR